MRALRDPEGVEVSHLVRACKPEGKAVLEIGCGDGIFACQYADLPRRWVGLDPDLSRLKTASQRFTRANDKIIFIQSIGEKLPFPSQSFDAVIFASSL